MLVLLFLSFDQVWAAWSGQDMPCGSATGGARGLVSVLVPVQTHLMEKKDGLPIWHLWEELEVLEASTVSHQAVHR